MQIEIKIDDSCIEPKVIILTDKMTDEINDILNTLSSKTPEVITGFYNDLAEILSPEDIIRIYAEGGKTFASVNKKEYIIRQRLYELEEQLTKYSFVRISNSEIINLKKVRSFDRDYPKCCVNLRYGVEQKHHIGGFNNEQKKTQSGRTSEKRKDPRAITEQRRQQHGRYPESLQGNHR